MENPNLNILIVDDDKTTSRLIMQILEIFGYHPETTNSGKIAIDMAKELSYDVILLDVMMPDIDGIEVCRRLKSDPETSSSIVVLLTALSDAEIKIASAEAGADAVLCKPFDVNQFVEMISNVAGGNKIGQ